MSSADTIKVHPDATALRAFDAAGNSVTLVGTPDELRATLLTALATLEGQAEVAIWDAVKAQQSYPCR